MEDHGLRLQCNLGRLPGGLAKLGPDLMVEKRIIHGARMGVGIIDTDNGKWRYRIDELRPGGMAVLQDSDICPMLCLS